MAELSKTELTNFYDSFLTNFLQTGNGMAANSLWLLFIHTLPSTAAINEVVFKQEKYDDIVRPMDAARTISEKPNQKGLVLAQGVVVNGESLNVDRIGVKNTGYIQGMVGMGRTAFPTLDIKILENNISFSDYFIRPWIISVGHKSLKDQNLKSNITVWFLGKTNGFGGAEAQNPFLRKAITYENCSPISIDKCEYNYSGTDMVKERSVSFVYTNYTFTPPDELLLELVSNHAETRKSYNETDKIRSGTEQVPIINPFYPMTATNSTIAADKLVVLNAHARNLITNSKRGSRGNLVPADPKRRMLEYLNRPNYTKPIEIDDTPVWNRNIVDRIVTNLVQNVGNKINQQISILRTKLLTFEEKGLATINDATVKALNSIIPNPNPAKNAIVRPTPQLTNPTRGPTPNTNANIPVNQNDTANYILKLKQIADPSSDDNVTINTVLRSVIATTDINDTPNSLQSNSKIIKTSLDDIPNNRNISFNNIILDKDDVVDSKTVKINNIIPNFNDSVSKNISFVEKTTDENDTP